VNGKRNENLQSAIDKLHDAQKILNDAYRALAKEGRNSDEYYWHVLAVQADFAGKALDAVQGKVNEGLYRSRGHDAA